MKIPLVLFTGGMDSTYLLYSALQNGPVDVLYVRGPQGPDKIAAEEKARENILKKIYEFSDLGKPTIHRVRKQYTVDLGPDTIDDHTFGQIAPWLYGALLRIRSFDHSELQIGYILGDQAMVYRTEIQNAWVSLVAFSKNANIPLSLPLATTSKITIMRHLPEGLRALTWSCELPVKKTRRAKEVYIPCGDCSACQTRKLTQAILNKPPAVI